MLQYLAFIMTFYLISIAYRQNAVKDLVLKRVHKIFQMAPVLRQISGDESQATCHHEQTFNRLWSWNWNNWDN